MSKAAQVHSKFKVFASNAGDPHHLALPILKGQVEAFASEGKYAPKSIGIEYMEKSGRLLLTLGYRDDEPGYKVKVTSADLGKIGSDNDKFNSGALEAAMTRAAAGVQNVLCHEFYVTGSDEFVMILMSHE